MMGKARADFRRGWLDGYLGCLWLEGARTEANVWLVVMADAAEPAVTVGGLGTVMGHRIYRIRFETQTTSWVRKNEQKISKKIKRGA
jgi:hypothetical protein